MPGSRWEIPGSTSARPTWWGSWQRAEGALTKTVGESRLVALPYDPQKPFGLTQMFCFARVMPIRGKDFAVFLFDEKEMPRFP